MVMPGEHAGLASSQFETQGESAYNLPVAFGSYSMLLKFIERHSNFSHAKTPDVVDYDMSAPLSVFHRKIPAVESDNDRPVLPPVLYPV